jgi:hypothetical protein
MTLPGIVLPASRRRIYSSECYAAQVCGTACWDGAPDGV